MTDIQGMSGSDTKTDELTQKESEKQRRERERETEKTRWKHDEDIV